MAECIARGFALGYAVVVWQDRSGVFSLGGRSWHVAYLTEEWDEIA